MDPITLTFSDLSAMPVPVDYFMAAISGFAVDLPDFDVDPFDGDFEVLTPEEIPSGEYRYDDGDDK